MKYKLKNNNNTGEKVSLWSKKMEFPQVITVVLKNKHLTKNNLLIFQTPL